MSNQIDITKEGEPVTPLIKTKSDFNRDTIVIIPLSDIKADTTWNARSRNSVLAEGAEDEKTGKGSSGLKGLILSIQSEGQGTPVDIIKNPTKSNEPWFLVAGFRRYEAIRQIGEKEKNPSPTIRAVVSNMSGLQARLLNLRENTARDDIGGADLCFGIAELFRLEPRLTQQKVAEILNKSTTYINKLYRITKETEPELVKHWRDTPGNPVTVMEMYALSHQAKGEQHKAYYDLFQGKSDAPAKQGDWYHAAKARAAKIGTMLGELEQVFGLKVTETLGDFKECAEYLVKLPLQADKRHKGGIAKSAYEAFIKARDNVEKEEKGDVF